MGDTTWPPRRAATLRRALLGWWRSARRDLPWRYRPGKADPYRVWVSEAMLQQTQVATVIPYFLRFLRRFPSIDALAAAPEEEVLALWSGLGYYARGRALHRAAREAVARHGGLPGRLEALRQLPGFGPYTAGAVASIAFGVRTPAIDGNASRVLSRIALVEGRPGTAGFRDGVTRVAERLLGLGAGGGGGHRRGRQGRLHHPGEINQAVIELGALLCRPRSPQCLRCPVRGKCGAAGRGLQAKFPEPAVRPRKTRVVLAAAVLSLGRRVLLARQPGRGLFGGMWVLPTAPFGRGQDPAAAIAAAIAREPSVSTGEFIRLGVVERVLTHRVLELHVVRGRLMKPPAAAPDWCLADPAELEGLAVPTAFRAVLESAANGAGDRQKENPLRGGIGKRAEKR